MKKLLLLLAVFTIMTACSDDSTPEVVRMKVMYMQSGTNGTTTNYRIQYGTSDDDSVRTDVDQAVYEYYLSQWEIAPNPRWRGEVTE